MIQLKRSQPAPSSLADRTKYNKLDVLERLEKDCHNKCYLCEELAPKDIQIEHHQPHKNNLDLKFDWNNLFLACYHCNNVKGIRSPLLNPCEPADQVEKVLKYSYQVFPNQPVIKVSTSDANEKASLTAALLNDIHNGTTNQKQWGARNLCKAIRNQITHLIGKVQLYQSFHHRSDEANYAKAELVRDLSRTSAFTAVKWSYMQSIYPEIWEQVAAEVTPL